MRGKEARNLRRTRCCGITPAYAGKRKLHYEHLDTAEDHPRVCGEKERLEHCACYAEGSPPRMRGKETGTNDITDNSRITPAYAGKSATGRCTACRYGDHPRVCGEKPAPAG